MSQITPTPAFLATAAAKVARNVRSAIDEHGMNRNAVAEAAGIDDSTLYRNLARTPQNLSVPDLVRISLVLGLNGKISQFFAGATA